MHNEHHILKSLLLKEELEVIENLKNKFLSQEQFSKEVSQVLISAIKRLQEQDQELEKVFNKPINKGVKRVLLQSKQSMIDAILPIMGQLIRKSVANNIRQFVSDINRTIELGFSRKAIKWRWQAFKSGTKFSEIVFQKTIQYQVRELFVINRENGLLIGHAGASGMLLDNNAISAMLTVIQDFIGDSLKSTERGLMSAEIDNNIIIISTGPIAYLASVIKGSPSERYREHSQQLVEHIHADFSDFLENEKLYQNNPTFNSYLRSHLVTKNRSEERNKINWMPWVFMLIIVISGLSYWVYYRNTQFNDVLERAQSIPGFFMQSVKRKNSGFEVIGLQDPIADMSKLHTGNIELITAPYLSLEPEITQKRIANISIHYPMIIINTDINNNGLELNLSGKIGHVAHQKLINKIESISGVNQITDQIEVIFPPKINNTPLKELLIDQINSTEIQYSAATTVHDNNEKIASLVRKVNTLFNQDKSLKLAIIGKSDCQGSLSDEFSKKRANLIKLKIVGLGINKDKINTTIKKCDNYDYKARQLDLKVSFRIESK